MNKASLIAIPLSIAYATVVTLHACPKEAHPEQYQNLPAATVEANPIVSTNTAPHTVSFSVPPRQHE